MITRRSLLCTGAASLLLPRRSRAWYHGNATVPAVNLTINLSFDASTSGAPAGWTTQVQTAANYLASKIFSPLTITLAVGYGECNGASLAGGVLGTNQTNNSFGFSYSAFKAALRSNAKSAAAIAAWNTLPASSPYGAITYGGPNCQMANLGLVTLGGAPHGFLGFSSTANFALSGTLGVVPTPSAGQFDFNATILHEMTECIGRKFAFPGSGNGCSALALYSFSSAGNNLFLPQSTAHYFSVDGGVTDLNDFNSAVTTDDGFDWAGSTVDAFNHSATSGQINPVSANDLLMLDVMGWSSQ